MNLYQGDAQTTNVSKVVIVGVLLALGIGIFVKFGVLDQLALLNQKSTELTQQRALINAVTNGGNNYGEMKDTYDAYLAQYGPGSIDVVSVLNMVDQQVRPSAEISNIVIADGTLTLTLKGASLETAGRIANEIGKQTTLVTSVNVSTASTQKTEGESETVIVAKLVGSSTGEGK
jgi:hypothetical protein